MANHERVVALQKSFSSAPEAESFQSLAIGEGARVDHLQPTVSDHVVFSLYGHCRPHMLLTPLGNKLSEK